MSVGTYKPKTLNDNWLEDRMQPSGSLNVTGGLDQRKARPHETDIAYIGERYDVLSRIARIPTRESYATPDDGFREWSQTSRVDFAHPKTRKEFVLKPSQRPRLITSESVPEICFEERRPLLGNKRGFGAVIQRHEDTHEKRFWNTSCGDFFGEGSRRLPMRRQPQDFHASGYSTALEEKRAQGVQVGQLAGESFAETSDPGRDTKAQRAWLYSEDAALRHVHLGGKRPTLPKDDNALSLPLGDGAMAKVRADLEARKGRLFRVATTITKPLGERPGINMFQDG
mmetsp:Transcript_41608/g.114703  ORF Transcript_41608/g.114703 Transcript_41608/m.114703 type:complete len:284 (-) Transcript_41608:268-1119(-)